MTWLAYSALGVAKRLTLDTQPGGALAGIPFVAQPVGRLLDGSGVLSRTTGTVVTVAKLSGTGTLSGTLTATTVEGVFTFTDLKMDTVAGTVILQFTAPGLVSVDSSSFNVTQPNTIIGCEVGTYTLTGAAQTLTRGPYMMRQDTVGSYAVTGGDVGLLYSGDQHPNEPAGYTLVSDRAFNAVTEDGWGNSGGSNVSIVTDAAAPISPTNVLQVRYPAGYVAGDAPWNGAKTITGSPTGLYYHWTIKWSANFQGQSSGTNKIGYVWVHSNPAVFFSAEGTGSGSLEAQFRLQNVPDSRGRLRPNLGTTAQQTLTRAAWHDLEVQIIANTPGVANGVARWWLNGVQIGEYTDVQYASAAQANTWQTISLYPIWGGVGGSVTNEMYIWFDNLRVSKG